MSKLTKEELEYHLCDIGLEATIRTYQITEKEIDSMLTAKVYGESARYIYKERKPELAPKEITLTPDKIQLYRVIKENYKVLRKYVVKEKWTVNSRANSKEDVFHNSLLAIMKGDFVYRSDVETINFLKHIFKNKALNEFREVLTTQEKSEQFTQLFKEETTEQPQINEPLLIENPQFLDVLSEKQRKIFELIAAGNTSREISEIVGIDIRSLSDYKKRIGVKINDFCEINR